MNEKEDIKVRGKFSYTIFVCFVLYGVLGFIASILFLMLSTKVGDSAAILVGLILGGAVHTLVSRYKKLPEGPYAICVTVLPFCINAILLGLSVLLTQGKIGSPIWSGVSLLNLSFMPIIVVGGISGSLVRVIAVVAGLQFVIASAGVIAILRKKGSTVSKKYKQVIVLGSVGILVLLSVTVYGQSFYQNRNTEIVGYGFEYGNGYSSVDISKYDPAVQYNQLAKLNKPASFHVDKQEDMPILDGAEAAYPVYAAFALATYNPDVLATNYEYAETKESEITTKNPVQFTNTIYAFESLVEGNVDIFFGAKPSEKQMEYAKNKGVELEITPIGKEAFIFIVSEDNPINGLSSEQIRDIYSGKIKNWKELGGNDETILAYQRPEGSGSQTMMQYFMQERSLMKPLKAEYIQGMGGTFEAVATYNGQTRGIGYSFRLFSQMSGKAGFKILEIDGVSVSDTTIANKEYPLVTNLVAVTVKDNPLETVKPFVEWMTSDEGKELVNKTGYVA